MKFSIITPTHERPELLIRAVNSAVEQTHTDWEMIVINDSPHYDYTLFENHISELKKSDPLNALKIQYITNETNMGNNFCKNVALQKVSSASDYVIFLDDDDWLHSEALTKVHNVLRENLAAWLVTNRSTTTQVLTQNTTSKEYIRYFIDYLLIKNFHGDATHTVRTSIARKNSFSTLVKNGEEVFFFLQNPSTFLYKNINTTFSDGYALTGMTQDLKNKYGYNTKLLWQEFLVNKNIYFFSRMQLCIYLLLRSLSAVRKLYDKK